MERQRHVLLRKTCLKIYGKEKEKVNERSSSEGNWVRERERERERERDYLENCKNVSPHGLRRHRKLVPDDSTPFHTLSFPPSLLHRSKSC